MVNPATLNSHNGATTATSTAQLYEKSLPKQLFTAGVSACIADFITFPLDTAKVRLQVQGEPSVTRKPVLNAGSAAITSPPHKLYNGLVGTISTIAKQEGYRSLYNGLSAGLQRQMCFASVRLGLYDSVKEIYTSIIDEKPDGLHVIARIAAGITTGAMAVILAQPTDVVKIRFQAEQRKNTVPRYRSTVQAYRTIGRVEGVAGLWRGSLPNIGRNAIVNVSEIVCYDLIKDILIRYAHLSDNVPCHFTAAVFAGLCTTVAASPVDVVKTRYMNAPPRMYSGAFDCARRMYAGEGMSAFFKGFMPSFARLVTWNICLWLTYEQVKKLVYNKRRVDVLM